MPRVLFVHGVGDPPGPGGQAMLQAWLDKLAAPMPDRLHRWLTENSAMAYYQDWSWRTDPDSNPRTSGSNVSSAVADIITEARTAIDGVAAPRLSDAAAAATRRKLLGMLASDRMPFIGYHMPFPAIGFVETRGDGFRYVPASYQLDL